MSESESNESVDPVAEAWAWATGKKSHWNTFCGIHGDRAWELAMCAAADAAETQKWAALATLARQARVIDAIAALTPEVSA